MEEKQSTMIDCSHDEIRRTVKSGNKVSSR